MSKYYKNYDECAHAWVHELSEDGHARGDRMFFRGPRIYSYGYHYMIARKVNDKVILFNAESSSSTTNKHKGQVMAAIPTFAYDVISVLELKVEPYKRGSSDKYIDQSWAEGHVTNMEYFLLNIARAEDKLTRVRSEYSRNEHQATIRNMLRFRSQYIKVFNLDKTPKRFKELRRLLDIDVNAPTGAVKAEMEAAAKKHEAAMARKRKAANKKATALAKEQLALWKDYKVDYIRNNDLLDKIYIRLSTDSTCIETTNSASVPIEHAKLMYKRYKLGKPVKGKKIGYYSVANLTDKDVTIGCTTIPLSEIRRVVAPLVKGE